MAVGDVYVLAPASVADTAYMTLQPAGSTEVVIHNIYTVEGSKYSIHVYDGTDDILVATLYSSAFNLQLHATNASYVRVQNQSGAAMIMGADGMTTKT